MTQIDGPDGTTVELRDDPRVRHEHVRVVDRDDGQVVLVGVVHDHPASVYRVEAVVEDVAPAVVALELPPLAVPLFEQFAADDAGDPGGEMSAAIGAAGSARIEGIDMPTTTYFGALVETARETAPGIDAVRELAAETVAVACHALRCRAAASRLPGLPAGDPVDALEHDCGMTDPPAAQADHEAACLAQSRSLLGALEAPVAARMTDEARETAMARRLAALDHAGDVVAVVGFDHLDAVASGLADR